MKEGGGSLASIVTSQEYQMEWRRTSCQVDRQYTWIISDEKTRSINRSADPHCARQKLVCSLCNPKGHMTDSILFFPHFSLCIFYTTMYVYTTSFHYIMYLMAIFIFYFFFKYLLINTRKTIFLFIKLIILSNCNFHYLQL